MKRLALLLFPLLLAGCAGGSATKHIYPPKSSLQEITVQADGHWTVKLRLQNFSDLAMTFAHVETAVTIAGQDAGRISADPGVAVGPQSAEIATVEFTPNAAAKDAIAQALAARSALRYALKGKITTRDPRGNYDFDYESALNPVPGLTGVLR